MKKKKKDQVLTKKDLLKMEIAREMGIWEQVEQEGWESLSNAVCGKVGGIMSKRLKEENRSGSKTE
ncbi:MAG TPA: small, acid-soluble spore protein, alpha/beta type [Syntrophomonadaceae bacterium]|nr:small, acid-soluble spore protein, alpha/beta type [Syntrophomonadaceae bacterium]